MEPEPAQLIEHPLIGGELVALACQPLQVDQPRIVAGQRQEMIGKLLKRGGGAEVSLVTIVLFRFAATP